jgi:hypothetical protein
MTSTIKILIPENVREHYAPQFVEIMERAKNLQPTTSQERRQLLAELFYLSVQTGTQFDHLTGRALNWFNWVSVVRNIERLRTEYANQ